MPEYTTPTSEMEVLQQEDFQVLVDKDKTYRGSWLKRGGVGAFMMLARKWDRLENISRANGWDIIEAGMKNEGDVLDDIADLRRYLLLVEAEIRRRSHEGGPWS